MDKHRQAVENDMGTLADDARALVAATADVAGDKIAEARKRLAAALDRSKELIGCGREKVVAGAQAVDQVVRENPYQTLALAFGVGAAIGYLAARRCSRNDD